MTLVSRRTLLSLSALLLLAAAGLPAAPAPGSAEIRARYRALLDRPRVPLAPSSTSEVAGEFRIERGRFHSEAKEVVPFLLYRPAAVSGRLPAVIVLHGTGGNKQKMEETLKELAARGLLALAIDGRYFGERVPGGASGSQQYQAAIIRAWKEPDSRRQEHPFYYDTVFDVWRTLDYLETREDVDPERIGAIGFSKGGIEAWMAAASDPRIRVVVPAIAVQSFRWSLENEQWQGRARTIQQAHDAAARDLGEPGVNARVCRALWNKIIPGALDELDCPNVLPAIAPRPMLILSGENDANCPLGGARLAFAAAEAAYRAANAADRLRIDVAPGVGHVVTPDQRRLAFDWLLQWLAPRAAGAAP